jgi:hypothetical protein
MKQNKIGYDFKKDEYESLYVIRDTAIVLEERLAIIQGSNSRYLEGIIKISDEGICNALCHL